MCLLLPFPRLLPYPGCFTAPLQYSLAFFLPKSLPRMYALFPYRRCVIGATVKMTSATSCKIDSNGLFLTVEPTQRVLIAAPALTSVQSSLARWMKNATSVGTLPLRPS